MQPKIVMLSALARPALPQRTYNHFIIDSMLEVALPTDATTLPATGTTTTLRVQDLDLVTGLAILTTVMTVLPRKREFLTPTPLNPLKMPIPL